MRSQRSGRRRRETSQQPPLKASVRHSSEHVAPSRPQRRSPADQQLSAYWWVGLKAKRIGEWWELIVPERIVSMPRQTWLATFPKKVARRLGQTEGIVLKGNTLRLRLFPEERPSERAQFHEIQVLYEDDFVLVVNKPSGLEVHPHDVGQTTTLANAIAAYYAYTEQGCRVRPIHRMDKDTTGPLLYAKNDWAHALCDEAMRQHRVERQYLALVEGVPRKRSGRIDAPIGQDRHHPTRRRVSPTGEVAMTQYTVIETFQQYALLRVSLETGRTHQIRVHLAHIGHPLAGDGMYGGHRHIIARQALHGERLRFEHPWTRKTEHIVAPLPSDFAHILAQLRRGTIGMDAPV